MGESHDLSVPAQFEKHIDINRSETLGVQRDNSKGTAPEMEMVQ